MNTDDNRPNRVGIKELARILGISTGTVSRSLNNRYGVNPETRLRVLEEARSIGYVPNAAARRLKAHPVSTVGLFFAPFTTANHKINPAALHLVSAFQSTAEAEGMTVRVVFFSSDAEMKAQVESAHMDAAVFYGHFEPETFRAIHALGIPAVILQGRTEFPDQMSVLIDTARTGFRAAQYLAALGHERLALVTSSITELHGAGYLRGFTDALNEFRLPLRKDWIFALSASESNKDGAFAALLPLLKKKDRPTGIVFASDWLALGGRRAAKEAHLQVPQELSLISYDNLPIASELDPPLTTFDVRISKLADLLTSMAKRLIESKSLGLPLPNKEVLIVPDLVKRQSCAPARTRVA